MKNNELYIPNDIYNYIYRIFFSKYVLPKINLINRHKWMWLCTHNKRNICTERGSIQLGYTNNDSWYLVYIKNFNVCYECNTKNNICLNCKMSYYNYVKT